MGIYTQSFGNSQCKRQLVSGPSRRYIGSYIDRSIGGAYKYAYEFPTPPEVDRELYCLIGNGKMKGKTFPAPLEVDSFTKPVNPAPVVEKPEFSSPLEVDRYLYQILTLSTRSIKRKRFRPLASR